jgi:hypothetical protein
MRNVSARPSARKGDGLLLDRLRTCELNRLARHRHPDGQGDYALPDTPTGHNLALAIVAHRLRRPGDQRKWIFQFCRQRASWLVPDEIEVAWLHPEKAKPLGDKIQLTAAERSLLRITTIAAWDQTAEQRLVLGKERKRERERERRRKKRAAAGCTPREQYEAGSKERTRPWEADGISKRTWYRRRQVGGTSTVSSNTLTAGQRTCATASQRRGAEIDADSVLRL